jgi:hypothetical protein
MTISNEAAAGMETVELEPLREDKKRIFKDILGISNPTERLYQSSNGLGQDFSCKTHNEKYYEDGKIVLS